MTQADTTDWDALRQTAWDTVRQAWELSDAKLDTLRFALYADSKCLLRDHGVKDVPPDSDGALPEPTAVDGYLDALGDVCAWLHERGMQAQAVALRDVLKGRAPGAPQRATNSMIDALHDASVRVEVAVEEGRRRGLEQAVALLRRLADAAWEKGREAKSTELHFGASEVEKLAKGGGE